MAEMWTLDGDMEDIEFDFLTLNGASSRRSCRFVATFDFYTPRPHLMILTRPGWRHLADFLDLDDESMDDLLQTAATIVDLLHLDGASPLLSLHRGKWMDGRGSFRAHLCIDIPVFIQIFTDYENITLPKWPTGRFVTRQELPQTYVDKVQQFPLKRFHDMDMMHLRGQKSAPTESLTEFQGQPIFYHNNKPMVGFTWKSGDRDSLVMRCQELLHRMEDFAQKLGLSGPMASDGCHLVLNTGDQVGLEGFVGTEDTEGVQGYVLMTPLRMYKICPEPQRHDWMEAIAQTDGRYMS